MVLILVGLIILAFCLWDFKRGTYLFLFYQVLWCPGMTVVKIGNSVITMGLLMSFGYVLIYFVKHGINIKLRNINETFPFTRPFIFFGFSYVLTCFFALGGFGGEITRAISILFQEFFVIWIIWYVITTERDYKILTKGFIIIFIAAGIYGILEYIAKNNPFVLMKSEYVEHGIVLYSNTAEALMRGYRVISFFEHPIGAGMTLSLFIVFVLVTRIKYDRHFPGIYVLLAYIGVALCAVCVILTKMRSALVFMFICMLGIVDFKKKTFWKLFLISVPIVLVILPFFKDNLQVLFSLFNKDVAKDVGGSTLAMRLEQLNAVVNIFRISPIAGLGEKFENLLVNTDTIKARGYESIWFVSLTRHGIIGFCANMYLLYYTVIKIPRKYHSSNALFLGLAYWITYTITTIPSFRLTIFYLLYFYFIRVDKKKNNATRYV